MHQRIVAGTLCIYVAFVLQTYLSVRSTLEGDCFASGISRPCQCYTCMCRPVLSSCKSRNACHSSGSILSRLLHGRCCVMASMARCQLGVAGLEQWTVGCYNAVASCESMGEGKQASMHVVAGQTLIGAAHL